MKKTLALAVLGAMTLAACGSKTDANEKNFGAAIAQYLDKKGELCLGIHQWPADVSVLDLRMQKSMPTGTAGRMEALAAAGLVSATDVDIPHVSHFDNKPTGGTYKVKRYVLTEAGKKFYREEDVNSIGLNGTTKSKRGDICYGKKALDKVVKWEGPMKLGDYQEAQVKYLYRIDNLADWAKKPEVLAAFPHVAQIIEGAGTKEQRGGVKLTSVGWEPLGLD